LTTVASLRAAQALGLDPTALGGVPAARRAASGDAAWFGKNPDRRIRIRQAVASEFSEEIGRAPVGMQWFALVLEAQPGARVRQPVALSIGFNISNGR